MDIKRHSFLSTSVVFLICFFSLSGSLFAFQNTASIKLSEIYREVITTEEEVLEYKNLRIIDDLSSVYNLKDSVAFIDRLGKALEIEIPVDSKGIVSNAKVIYLDYASGASLSLYMLNLEVLDIKLAQFDRFNFYNLQVDSVFMDSARVTSEFRVEDSYFSEFFDTRSEYGAHHIINTEFSSYYNMYYSTIHKEFYIIDSRFKEGAHIGPHFEGTFTDFLIEQSTFEQIDSELPLLLEEVSPDSVVYKTQVVFNMFGLLHQFTIADNYFLSKGDEQHVYLTGEYQSLFIQGNLFESHLYASAQVSTKMDFLENENKGNIMLAELIIESKNNQLHWREFEGFKFAGGYIPANMFTEYGDEYGLSEDEIDQLWRQTSNFAIGTYRATTDKELEDDDSFQSLISSYYRIYKIFKDNGQVADANETYVEMKDVQIRQLRYKYKEYGGLENFIQWRLNQLLKFYTDYGTNPSRAIRISIIVMFVFSIFYFFFPSEWDTKSKKQLIGDYKIFIEKNDHGYFKPFVRLSTGFFVSLLNAMTLSLNSFVTLGFGTIPTSGLARYICILQGFIGWFLLSLFTASLINQVMF